VIPRYLTNELLKNLVTSYTELGNQRTYTKEQEKTVEGYRLAASNLSGFLRKYRENRPKFERTSYELVPAVLHKSEKNDIISTIYGGVSFNCRLTENSNLKNQKIRENRHEINVSSNRKINTAVPKSNNQCGNDKPSCVIEANPPSYVNLGSRKEAQEAARRAGKGNLIYSKLCKTELIIFIGKPIYHKDDSGKGPHFHPVNKNGDKIDTAVFMHNNAGNNTSNDMKRINNTGNQSSNGNNSGRRGGNGGRDDDQDIIRKALELAKTNPQELLETNFKGLDSKMRDLFEKLLKDEDKSKLPAEFQQISGNDDIREITPCLSPKNFERFTSDSKNKVLKNKKTKEIWAFDHEHKNHFEVYKNAKEYENSKRCRAVYWDGRPRPTKKIKN
jgi:hypothetical protein